MSKQDVIRARATMCAMPRFSPPSPSLPPLAVPSSVLFSLPLLLVHSMLSDRDDGNVDRSGDLNHHQHIVRSIGEEF